MITTLNKIRAHDPCRKGWIKLLRSLNKSKPDDEPLNISRVLDSNGLADALWCLQAVEGYDREIRSYAVWCARRVQHLLTDPRSLAALEVAERYAHGRATAEEMRDARSAAREAALSMQAPWMSVLTDALTHEEASAAVDAAATAAWGLWVEAGQKPSQVRETEREAQAAELRRICEETAT